MFFALSQMVEITQGSFMNQLTDPFIFRRKAELLSIHQFEPGLVTHLNHFIGLLQSHGKGLFDNDVLPMLGRRQYRLMMQEIREADIDHLATGSGNGFFKIIKRLLKAVLARKSSCLFAITRVDPHHLSVWNETLVGLEVNIGNETCP